MRKNMQWGFTLLELLTVVAIIGVLASLSLTRYQSHIISSNRLAAKNALLMAQQGMERQFLRAGTYEGATLPAAQPNDPYVLSFSTAPTQNAYSIIATPASSSPADPECNGLSIDNTGRMGSNGTLSAAQCWR